jgi:hypothetical protein
MRGVVQGEVGRWTGAEESVKFESDNTCRGRGLKRSWHIQAQSLEVAAMGGSTTNQGRCVYRIPRRNKVTVLGNTLQYTRSGTNAVLRYAKIGEH